MPLFYFHLRGPAGLDPDEIGLEFPSLEEAYLEACRTVPGMAAEFVRAGRDPTEHAFEVADAAGVLLMEVPFGERLRGAGPPRRPASPGAARAIVTSVERAQQLAASVQEQVAALHATVERAKAILDRSSGDEE